MTVTHIQDVDSEVEEEDEDDNTDVNDNSDVGEDEAGVAETDLKNGVDNQVRRAKTVTVIFNYYLFYRFRGVCDEVFQIYIAMKFLQQYNRITLPSQQL